jgi:hypothetical protein
VRRFLLCPRAFAATLVLMLCSFAAPTPVTADTISLGCIYEGGSPTTPPINYPSLFECDANRNVKVAGTLTASVAFPYNGTNGQTLKTGSFLGVGALDANGAFSPLQEDASQNLLAKIVTGSTTAVTQPTASNLNATIVGAGVAGTPAGGVVSVQGVAGGTAQPVTGMFFQATQPVSCATAATCPTNATLLAGSANAGGFELFDSAGTNKASINLPGAQLTALGKTTTILTSGSATACTNIQATAGNLVELVNVGSATTVFPAFYNDAAATCATGTRIYGNFTSLTLQAGQAIQLNIPLSAGLAYKLSGALSDNLVVVTN